MKNRENWRKDSSNTITHDCINLSGLETISRICDYHFRALRVRPRGKEAVEKNWQTTNNYALSSPEIRQWIVNGGNVGMTCPSGFGCMIDADTGEIQKVLDSELPTTFRYSTGKMGHYQYLYYLSDTPIGCLPLKDGAYVKGRGGYALGPGSVHPNGVVYGSRELRDVPITIVTHADLMGALEPFLVSKPESTDHFTGHTPSAPGTAEIDTAALIEILTPYWANATGLRNELTMSIAGFIARSGGTEDDATHVVSELARLTGKGSDHIVGARYAFRRDGPVRGLTSLTKILEGLQ